MWRAFATAAFATCALFASASADEPSLRWSDLTRISPQAQGRYANERAADPTAYTVAEGDFDGDGQRDHAALYFHRDDLIVAARLSAVPNTPVEVWRGTRVMRWRMWA